jgi:hypothetical protein
LARRRTQSKDSLTLDEWTKPLAGEKEKAVLAWMYRGATSPDF